MLSLLGKVLNRFGAFIYPDSYYYLLVAKNLRENLHPVGTLGEGGMPFPPAGYAAMKVTYPLGIAKLALFGLSGEAAARFVTVSAAVACVPLAWWATRRLFGSERTALGAATLVAFSYGITFWSGFVLSDSLSLALAFVALALFARERADALSNPADALLGLVLVLLLLTRPTYVAVIPFVIWGGAGEWRWTWRRGLTAGVAALLVLSGVAATWFPPADVTASIARNLAPLLLAVAALAVALAAAAVRARRSRPALAPGRARAVATVAACAFLALWLAERAPVWLGAGPWFSGWGRFAPRDVAVLLAAAPGVWALWGRGRDRVVAALLAAAIAMTGVYFAVESFESRYLIHILPLLVPLAGGALAFAWREEPAEGGAPRAVWAAVVALLACALAWQAALALGVAETTHLRTDYPREVAYGARDAVRRGDVVVTALPWPLHHHLGLPTWGVAPEANRATSPAFLGEKPVVVIDDAAMRLFYPLVSERLEAGFSEADAFEVPVRYSYGRLTVSDEQPVRVYRLTQSELRSVVDTRAASPDLVSAYDEANNALR